MAKPTQHTLKITKESLKKVTMFDSRAELRREFTVDLVKGANEVAIQAISSVANDSTVRVSVKGAAVIEDVQVAQRRMPKSGDDKERYEAVKKEKEGLETEKASIDCDAQIVDKQADTMDEYIESVSSTTRYVSPSTTDSCKIPDDSALERLSNLFDFHRKKVAQFRKEHRKLVAESLRLSGLITAKDAELKEMAQGVATKNVIVLLDAPESGQITLELNYQVAGGLVSAHLGWHPLYDARVHTREGKMEMQLYYYANVQQNTGEDWEGAQLVLSTARPTECGTLPALRPLDVSLSAKSIFGSPVTFGETKAAVLFGAVPPATADGKPTPLFSFGTGAAAPKPAVETTTPKIPFGCSSATAGLPQTTAITSKIEKASFSAGACEPPLHAEFVIARPCSIPSDGEKHRVTIGIISLEPLLYHESVPSKNAAAFLTASAINPSQHLLLPGTVSVYLDGTFSTRTTIVRSSTRLEQAIRPGERFYAGLGPDPALIVEYKPVLKFDKMGLAKSASSTEREQKIMVRNTKGNDVLLLVREQIPRSIDEKIKVNIISPEAVEKVEKAELWYSTGQRLKLGARLLPSNNLEWVVKLGKGESQTLHVKYSIEHPSDQKVEFNERFGWRE